MHSVAHALVDTGAIVALVNRADRFHSQATAWFRDFRGRLLTTEAVITETAYVLAASPEHQSAALNWIRRARDAEILEVVPIQDHADLVRIIAKYADLPCDYADASLIWLAEKTGVVQIATIDQRDFSIYRIRGRRRFRILLGPS
jgi:predicted nucleic acid-binding protein